MLKVLYNYLKCKNGVILYLDICDVICVHVCLVRGFVKLKKIKNPRKTRIGQTSHTLMCLVKLKNSKNPRKTRIGQTTPTHPPIQVFIFLGKQLETWKQYKKHKISKKILKSKLRLDPPTHFRVFLGFLDFFQLDKTPYPYPIIFFETCLTKKTHKKHKIKKKNWVGAWRTYPRPIFLFFFTWQNPLVVFVKKCNECNVRYVHMVYNIWLYAKSVV